MNNNNRKTLHGKTFYFLGSSVTYGESDGISFVDYIATNNGSTCIKEAVCGTTLADISDESYIRRFIANSDISLNPDHFICQLSTNDAGQNIPLGTISDGYSPECFNTKTVIGAIEFIVYHALNTWQCPVSFYTNTWFDNSAYANMVNALFSLQQKWSFGIINLWNDSGRSNTVDSVREKYMNDFIHPNKLGYKEWWTPIFENHLAKFI